LLKFAHTLQILDLAVPSAPPIASVVSQKFAT
jgi:hypothetical protein